MRPSDSHCVFRSRPPHQILCSWRESYPLSEYPCPGNRSTAVCTSCRRRRSPSRSSNFRPRRCQPHRFACRSCRLCRCTFPQFRVMPVRRRAERNRRSTARAGTAGIPDYCCNRENQFGGTSCSGPCNRCCSHRDVSAAAARCKPRCSHAFRSTRTPCRTSSSRDQDSLLLERFRCT